MTDLRRVRELFDQAIDLEPEQRRAFISGLSGADQTLIPELEELLAVDEDIEDLRLDFQANLPSQIGSYVITKEIARGGMSIVYEGTRRIDDTTVRFAIKVLPVGLGIEPLINRLAHERRILSWLEHPHITRLVDAGVTSDGRPYLVMEHVDGVTITDYCRRAALSVAERLELFRTVTRAVHFAHQHLVVHRDLKPSNILVDAHGSVKLLDFGIAKILDTGNAFAALTTPTLPAPMTPDYASPEQLRRGAVTTASDIYALGVLLWELLTGASFAATWPGGPTERLRHPATPPSQAGGLQRSERRRLSGDLDAIVLRALELEPARRYLSAEALSDDLHRFCTGQPVAARRWSRWSLVWRFARRNAAAVAASSVAVLALLGLTTSLTLQTRWLGAERDRAQTAKETLLDVLGQLDPDRAPAEDLSVENLLDHGIERIHARFPDDPNTRAELIYELARIYVHLRLPARARALYEEVWRLEQAHDLSHDRQLRARLAVIKIDQAAYSLSVTHQEMLDVLASLRERPVQDLGLRVEVLVDVARTSHRIGRMEEAAEIYRQALAARAELPAGDLRLAHVDHELGFVLAEQWHTVEAELHLRRALEAQQIAGKRFGTLAALLDLGHLLVKAGRQDEGLALLQEAEFSADDLLVRHHPNTTDLLSKLIYAHHMVGDLDGARQYTLQFEANRRAHPDAVPWVQIEVLTFMAGLTLDRGECDAARGQLTEALNLSNRTSAGGPRLRHALVSEQARIDVECGRDGEAEALMSTLAQRADPDDDPVIHVEDVLSQATLAHHHRDDAVCLARVEEAARTLSLLVGPRHWRWARAEVLGAACRAAVGQCEGAVTQARAALALLEELRGSGARVVETARSHLAEIEAACPRP